MDEADKINVQSLQEEAKKSEDKEAFTVLAKMRNCRIGIGARLESPDEPTFFIEVLVSLCTGRNSIDLDLMEKKLSLLRQLTERGHLLTCEEDGCISCELAVPRKNLITECKATISTLKKCVE